MNFLYKSYINLSMLAIAWTIAVFLIPNAAQSKDVQPPLKTAMTVGGRLVSNLDRTLMVQTPIGKILCAPKTTVYIFQTERGLAIFNFDSNKKDDVQLQINNKHYLVHAAEQLVVSRRPGLKFDDINPGLGIIHKGPSAIDMGAEYSGYLAEFSLASGIKKIPLLTKMASSDKQSEQQVIKRILKNAAILQSSAEPLLEKRIFPRGTAAYAPINNGRSGQMLQGGVERFSVGAKQFLDMRVNETYRKGFPRFAGLSWVELIDNDWKLRDIKSTNSPCEVAGLLMCPIDTVIRTELGYIDCKKGSTVFIVNRGESIAVCTLDSPHVDDVNVRIANKPPMRLSPGREILLTRDLENSFDKVNPTHQIGYRDEKEIGTVDGTKVVRADFSLAAAMMSVEPLRRLATSRDSQEVNLAESIVKNSVILWGLTANHGVFHAPK